MNSEETSNQKSKKGMCRCLWWKIWHFSGLRYIWEEKINPPKETGKSTPKPATFFIWAIGVYVALYGVATQHYENRLDIIENRANSIFTQLGTPVYKKALSGIAKVQNTLCPQKPYFLKPWTVFGSLLGKELYYGEMVELLKNTLENWKKELADVDLEGAQLQGAELNEAVLQEAWLWEADLKEADLQEADLCGAVLQKACLQKAQFQYADLRWVLFNGADLQGAILYKTNINGAEGLTLEMLLEVKTLYGVKGLNPKLRTKIVNQKPELLFKEPNDIKITPQQKTKRCRTDGNWWEISGCPLEWLIKILDKK